MSPSTPDPVALSRGSALWLAYRTTREDGHCAVLLFHGVETYSVGPPNDERLEHHPLFVEGLRSYGFHTLPSAGPPGLRRWVITFHDETVDVTAATAEVVVRAVEAIDPRHALDAVLA